MWYDSRDARRLLLDITIFPNFSCIPFVFWLVLQPACDFGSYSRVHHRKILGCLCVLGCNIRPLLSSSRIEQSPQLVFQSQQCIVTVSIRFRFQCLVDLGVVVLVACLPILVGQCPSGILFRILTAQSFLQRFYQFWSRAIILQSFYVGIFGPC